MSGQVTHLHDLRVGNDRSDGRVAGSEPAPTNLVDRPCLQRKRVSHPRPIVTCLVRVDHLGRRSSLLSAAEATLMAFGRRRSDGLCSRPAVDLERGHRPAPIVKGVDLTRADGHTWQSSPTSTREPNRRRSRRTCSMPIGTWTCHDRQPRVRAHGPTIDNLARAPVELCVHLVPHRSAVPSRGSAPAGLEFVAARSLSLDADDRGAGGR